MGQWDELFERIALEARAKIGPDGERRVFDASGGHADDHATRDRLWAGQLLDAARQLAALDVDSPAPWHLLAGFWLRLDDVTDAMYLRHQASSAFLTDRGGGQPGTMGARLVRIGNASKELHDALTDDERLAVSYLRNRAGHSHTNAYEIRWDAKRARVSDKIGNEPIEPLLERVRQVVQAAGGAERFARALASRVVTPAERLAVTLHRANLPA